MGDRTDLGNPDGPTVDFTADLDVEALTDHRTIHAAGDVPPVGAAQGLRAAPGGLNGHEGFPVSDDGPRARIMRPDPERLIGVTLGDADHESRFSTA
jgi:hypothetical protein